MLIRILFTTGSILATITIVVSALVFLQPEWVFSHLRKRSPDVIYSVKTSEKVVALTIDDGPDPETTEKILGVLNQNRAKATFFLITGRVRGNEHLVERMLEEGHELANHLTQDEPSIFLTLPEFEKSLGEAHQVLSKFSELRWFRPGSGWYNSDMISIAQDHGYQTALGSVYPYDPQLGSAWFSANYVLWKIRPGSIIVLHDYQMRGNRTASALKTILPELSQRGYRVVTLSELADLPQSK